MLGDRDVVLGIFGLLLLSGFVFEGLYDRR
jgi:hypothetical protein